MGCSYTLQPTFPLISVSTNKQENISDRYDNHCKTYNASTWNVGVTVVCDFVH